MINKFKYVVAASLLLLVATIDIPKVSASPLSVRLNTINSSTSLNWAGYVADQGKFTAVSGSWIVPNIKNSKTLKTDATWVGIGGVGTADLIQAGTQSLTDGSGQSIYRAWYEMLPDYAISVPLQFSAGDSASVLIIKNGVKNWKITIKNNTTKQSFVKNVTYNSTLSSAEWIEELPSDAQGLMKLDNFKSVNFTSASATLSGKKVNLKSAGARAVSLAKPNGKILALVSKVSKNGHGFMVVRK